MEIVEDKFRLPNKKRHCRKTFATETLKLINSRLGYYRKIFKDENITDQRRINSIKAKFERDMKIRKLLNKAIYNLYN